MTHAEIEEQDIIDGYLLGKLAAETQEQFELHFLTCVECLERLETGRSAVALIAAACEGERPAGPRWLWSPAFAVAAVIVMAVWVTVGRAPSPPAAQPGRPPAGAALPVIELSTVRSGRGPAAGLRAAEAAGPFRLRLDLLGLGTYRSYSVEIASERGAIVWFRKDLSEVGEEALEVQVEGAALGAGRYWVRLLAPGAGGPVLLREYGLAVAP